jgi:hypothetical protein
MAFGRGTPGSQQPRTPKEMEETSQPPVTERKYGGGKPVALMDKISVFTFNPDWSLVEEALYGDPRTRSQQGNQQHNEHWPQANDRAGNSPSNADGLVRKT